MKTIICEGDGSFSSFLSKMGLFKKTGNAPQKQIMRSTSSSYSKSVGFRGKPLKGAEGRSVDQKVATVATSYETQSDAEKTEDVIPHLPGSHLDK